MRRDEAGGDQPVASAADQVTINTNKLKVDNGAVAGVDRSTNKSTSKTKHPRDSSMETPVGLLAAALKHLPALWYAVGVAAVIGLLAIMRAWNLPAAVTVFGGLGIFICMFGLLIFVALVQNPLQATPPVISLVALWAFGLILIACGLLLASSVFFNWPITLRDLIVSRNGH